MRPALTDSDHEQLAARLVRASGELEGTIQILNDRAKAGVLDRLVKLLDGIDRVRFEMSQLAPAETAAVYFPKRDSEVRP